MEYRLSYADQPTTIVYLSLKGDDLIPDVISTALEVSPYRAWKKGDHKYAELADDTRNPIHEYTFGHWSLEAPCSPYDEAETQLFQLLDRLEPLAQQLHPYIQQYRGTIVVAVASSEPSIGFTLPPDLLRRIGQLGITLVFDIYPFEHDVEETTSTIAQSNAESC